jgi:uncharacterized membrane protein
MYQFLWIFFIYAFLGWCTEVSYAALVSGKFVNRGFLNGPLCPVYGFGVVIVLLFLTPLKDNFLLLFLGSVLLTSLLEWVTGFLLELIFHQRWWDYSDQPFNLGGYICLRFSIGWGLACVFVVDILHPTIAFFIRHIPHTLGVVLLVVLSLAMTVDLIATVSTILKMNRRLRQIDELAAKIKDASNEFGENLADKVMEAAEKGSDLRETLDDWKDDLSERRDEARLDAELGLYELRDNLSQRKTAAQTQRRERRAALRGQLLEWKDAMQELLEQESFGQRRLLAAFPKMRSTDHHAALLRLRRRMERRQGKRKYSK